MTDLINQIVAARAAGCGIVGLDTGLSAIAAAIGLTAFPGVMLVSGAALTAASAEHLLVSAAEQRGLPLDQIAVLTAGPLSVPAKASCAALAQRFRQMIFVDCAGDSSGVADAVREYIIGLDGRAPEIVTTDDPGELAAHPLVFCASNGNDAPLRSVKFRPDAVVCAMGTDSLKSAIGEAGTFLRAGVLRSAHSESAPAGFANAADDGTVDAAIAECLVRGFAAADADTAHQARTSAKLAEHHGFRWEP